MTAQHSLIASPSKKGKPTARARKRLADAPPIDFTITNLAHDGRGVAVYETDNESHNPDKAGKKIFVSFALPNETVSVKVTATAKRPLKKVMPKPSSQTPIHNDRRHHVHISPSAVVAVFSIGMPMVKSPLSNQYSQNCSPIKQVYSRIIGCPHWWVIA